jgi:NAD(P)-dependent dehydrogenase (short-subunit alcohol dehydrogenase family)
MTTAIYPSLRDRVAIITGGGQGLGRAYAHAFAAQGAIPVIAEIDTASARSVVDEIEANGGRALAIETNVADEDSTLAMAADTLAAFGRIDCLINNAALFSRITIAPFWELPLSEWEDAMRVNVTGAFLCARAVAPAMMAAGFGRIINVSSTTVLTGAANYLHYITSKSAMIAMTRSMSRELGPHGVTVHLFWPGAVETEVDRPSVSGSMFAELATRQSLPRPATMDDFAAAVLFLCSDDAEYLTGQALVANGGLAFP